MRDETGGAGWVEVVGEDVVNSGQWAHTFTAILICLREEFGI
jgi:hypothetical protein